MAAPSPERCCPGSTNRDLIATSEHRDQRAQLHVRGTWRQLFFKFLSQFCLINIFNTVSSEDFSKSACLFAVVDSHAATLLASSSAFSSFCSACFSKPQRAFIEREACHNYFFPLSQMIEVIGDC